MTNFTKVILFTDTDGKARFKEETMNMGEGTVQSQLTEVFSAEAINFATVLLDFAANFMSRASHSGSSSCLVKWKLVCKMASLEFFLREIISIRQTLCLKVQLLMHPSMATGVGRSGKNPCELCSSRIEPTPCKAFSLKVDAV